jgi:hypothetical protein
LHQNCVRANIASRMTFKPMLPYKPRGFPQVNVRRVLSGIF